LRQALRKQLPALSRFYHGAITPLNVNDYTYGELNEYVMQMQRAQQDEGG
jgi:hypothetical protein